MQELLVNLDTTIKRGIILIETLLGKQTTKLVGLCYRIRLPFVTIS